MIIVIAVVACTVLLLVVVVLLVIVMVAIVCRRRIKDKNELEGESQQLLAVNTMQYRAWWSLPETTTRQCMPQAGAPASSDST